MILQWTPPGWCSGSLSTQLRSSGSPPAETPYYAHHFHHRISLCSTLTQSQHPLRFVSHLRIRKDSDRWVFPLVSKFATQSITCLSITLTPIFGISCMSKTLRRFIRSLPNLTFLRLKCLQEKDGAATKSLDTMAIIIKKLPATLTYLSVYTADLYDWPKFLRATPNLEHLHIIIRKCTFSLIRSILYSN